jgi:hypothetical protein
MKLKGLFTCTLIILSGAWFSHLHAQADAEPSYETMYDEPYNINKLYLAFQPLYGELFATNVNAGFGLEAEYYHGTKFNLKAHTRKTYSSKFFDFNRELALKNSSVSNTPEIFNYFELGGTYHISDFDVYSKTKFLLIPAADSKKQRVPTAYPGMMEVSGKLRKIIGARAGAIIWNSTMDVNRTLEDQGLSNSDLKNSNNESLQDAIGSNQQINVFSNIYATNIYVGGSLALIRNMAVDFEGYSQGLEDGIFTVFFDLMYAPSLRIDPIVYNDIEYASSPIKLSTFGARLGAEGKFNRKLGWGYGGELGYRPSISGSGFFAMFKISFPVYSSDLKKKEKDTE